MTRKFYVVCYSPRDGAAIYDVPRAVYNDRYSADLHRNRCIQTMNGDESEFYGYRVEARAS
jgi:hypothetical protein